MISKISPFKDFAGIKVCNNRCVWCFEIVLVCPCLCTNRISEELQTLLCLFFLKFELPNQGCGYLTGAAYTRNFQFMVLIITHLWPALSPTRGQGTKLIICGARSKEKYNMPFLNEFNLHENEQVCRIFIRNGFTRILVWTHRQKATLNWPILVIKLCKLETSTGHFSTPECFQQFTFLML